MTKPQVPPHTKKLTSPTLIPASQALRFLWGDLEAGLVSDWIYGSSDKIHLMAFSLPPGQKFTNSADFQTCYNAFETYYCLSGEFSFHNPQTATATRQSRPQSPKLPAKPKHAALCFMIMRCASMPLTGPPLLFNNLDMQQSVVQLWTWGTLANGKSVNHRAICLH